MEVNELGFIDKFIYEKLAADAALLTLISANERQQVTKGSHTGGTFTLEFVSQVSTAINYDETAASLQTKLEALSNIAPGDVAVTGVAGGPWTVDYAGVYANVNVPQLIMVSSLTGGSGQKVSTLVEGGPRIYSELAPQGHTFPYVLFGVANPGRDRIALGRIGVRIFTRPIYLVRAVTKGESLVAAGQIADRIEAVLGGLVGNESSSGIRIGIHRMSPYRLPEVFEGIRLNHVGGLYQLFVSSS